MKHRNPFAVVILSIITFGIYALYWEVKTKSEMNRMGATIPSAWLLIIPFVSIWWLWKYSEGVDKVTNGKLSAILAFILMLLLGVIGMAIVQSEFNKVGEASPVATAPSDPTAIPPAPTAVSPAPAAPNTTPPQIQ